MYSAETVLLENIVNIYMINLKFWFLVAEPHLVIFLYLILSPL